MSAEALVTDEALANAIVARGVMSQVEEYGSNGDPCWQIAKHIIHASEQLLRSWEEADVYDQVFERMTGENATDYETMIYGNNLADEVAREKQGDSEAAFKCGLHINTVLYLSGQYGESKYDIERLIEILDADPEDRSLTEFDQDYIREEAQRIVANDEHRPDLAEHEVGDYDTWDENFQFLAMKGV